jgi:hypothetical protein
MRHHYRPTILCFWGITLCANLVSLPAGDKPLEGETLGKLTVGQKSDQVTALLGKPESKGKDSEWAATGEWVQEWRFQAHGLQINMASNTKGGAKSIASITAVSPCKLTTARGIQIGSSIANVTKAYKNVQDREQSVPGKTFVAGSIYGGVIFTFKDGKVSQIFLGAAAE